MEFKHIPMLIKGEFGPNLNSYILSTTCFTHLSHSMFALKRFRHLKKYQKKILWYYPNYVAGFRRKQRIYSYVVEKMRENEIPQQNKDNSIIFSSDIYLNV